MSTLRPCVIFVIASLSGAWGCASRESHPVTGAARPSSTTSAASTRSSAGPSPHPGDADVLKAVLVSNEPGDVLFTRMRAAVKSSKGWQFGMSYEGWGTTELYCRGSAVTRGTCPTPGAAMRSFMYGSAGAFVTVHEPSRPGQWGMDANFGGQYHTIRFGRNGARGVANPELDVGSFTFVVERAGFDIRLDGVDQVDLFARLTASPESFHDVVLEKLELLKKQVQAQLAPEAKFEIIVDYDGCVPIMRDMDAREKAQQIAKAERDITRRKELVDVHFREFHALVSALVVVR